MKQPDLASESVGGAVIWANDEFFASKDNLVKASKPVWKPEAYTDRGKWMDGWETRRRRKPGHDRCVIRLGLPGIITKVDIDTSHFDGNQPEFCSIEGCYLEREPDPEQLAEDDSLWTPILEQVRTHGDSHNVFEIDSKRICTHLRLHIHPDGGVARLRAFGEAMPDLDRLERIGEYNVAAIQNGGQILAVNDEHFGRASNLLLPTRPKNMGDGWETRRRRDDGHDWVTVRLGAESRIRRAVIDTEHFKGNFPAACKLEACHSDQKQVEADADWNLLLEKSSLRAHTANTFEGSLKDNGPVTHVRMKIYPDGGVARFRVFGEFSQKGFRNRSLMELNALPDRRALDAFLACCGSNRWAEKMLENRPYKNLNHLTEAAETIWHDLEKQDWLEAFEAHPQIGDRADEGDQTDRGEDFSRQEQAGTSTIDRDTQNRLEQLNREYYEKFGFIYIVFASGKSAEQMLEILEDRIENDRETEIKNAGREQLKITKLRLNKLVSRQTQD